MHSWTTRIRGAALILALAALPAATLLAAAPAEAGPGENGWLGVTLQPLNDDLRDALGIDRRVRGVLVNSVMDGSPAEAAGLRVHDVIVSVDGHRTPTVDTAVEAVREAGSGEEVLVVVHRRGTERGLTASLGEADRRVVERRDFRPRSGEGDVFVLRGEDEGDAEAPKVFRWKDHGDDDAPAPKVFRWKHRSDDEDDGDEEGRIIIFHGDDGERRVIELDGDEDGPVVLFGGDGDRARRHEFLEQREKAREKRHQALEKRHELREHAREMRKHLREEIVDRKRRDRERGGYLGVETMALNDQLADHFGVDADRGVLITRVVEESPAEEGGLRAGDVILAVDGEGIRSADHLRRVIRAAGEDEEVSLLIVREGREREMQIRLADSTDFGMGWRTPGDLEISLPDLSALHELEALGDLHEFPEGEDFELHFEGLEDLGRHLEKLGDRNWNLRFDGGDFDEEDLERLHEDLDEKLEKLQENLDGIRIRINDRDWNEEDVHEALQKARRALEDARRKIEREIRQKDR